MILFLAGLFGLVFGSFLNVCIYRLPRELGVVTPRSFCPECGVPIAAFDNIPLLSFLWLRGRCRGCGRRISWRYPAVEALTAIVFVLVVKRYGLAPETLKWLLFEAIVIVLFFTDLEERLLPDEFTLGGLMLGFALAFFIPVPGALGDLLFSHFGQIARSLCNLLLGAGVLSLPIWGIAFLYSRLRKRDAMGLGDVKLLALLGSFFGLETGVTSVLAASLAGSAAGIFLLLRHRSAALQFELPFGSFLCAAALVMPLAKTLS